MMMIGKKKEEGLRGCTVLWHLIRKSPIPSENRLTAVLNLKKSKSIQGFKPGLLRQNTIALPLVPPPLQMGKFSSIVPWHLVVHLLTAISRFITQKHRTLELCLTQILFNSLFGSIVWSRICIKFGTRTCLSCSPVSFFESFFVLNQRECQRDIDAATNISFLCTWLAANSMNSC